MKYIYITIYLWIDLSLSPLLYLPGILSPSCLLYESKIETWSMKSLNNPAGLSLLWWFSRKCNRKPELRILLCIWMTLSCLTVLSNRVTIKPEMLLLFSHFSIQDIPTIFKPFLPVKQQLINPWWIRAMLSTDNFVSTVQRTSPKFSWGRKSFDYWRMKE